VIKPKSIYMQISNRELQILSLISKGYSNKTIGTELDISFNTVHTYRRRLLLKLDAKNSADLIRIAFEKKILPLIEVEG